MKITVLTENTACRDDLIPEHGLSLFIETGARRILFDAGQTDAFARNAEAMGIDLGTVDFAVLSHGHYDHGGGLRRFLELNQTAPVYLRRDAFGAHFNGTEKYIGLDVSLKESGRLIFTDDILDLGDGITLCSKNSSERSHGFNSFGLNIRQKDRLVPDTFLHEQYLLVEESGKRICISGCSHKGILNIISWFQPDVLIGGFHFMKLDPAGADAAVLEQAARVMLNSPARYFTGHCTGTAPFDFLKDRMGSRLEAISAGAVIEV